MALTNHIKRDDLSKPESEDAKNPLLTVRIATVADVALIRRLIIELATYEKELHLVCTTEADIERDGFGDNPQFRVLIGEWHGKPVGFAVFFHYYSTWRGTGLYLEDLFVLPEFRGRGIGTALLASVARAAVQEGRVFVRWAVLDWNQPAIDMYKSLGAHFLNDWRPVLLMGEDLRKLAKRGADGAPESGHPGSTNSAKF
jgi:GNAT superfamily N-acetyltransferase